MFKQWLHRYKNKVYEHWTDKTEESFLTLSKRVFNNSISNIALKYAKAVYKKHIDLGSTEYMLTDLPFCQVLAITGSNEKIDWLLNFILLSWKDIKLPAYLAARRLHKIMVYERDLTKPLLVTGHSKGGTTAPAYFYLYCNPDNDYLVYFNPCPGVKGHKHLGVNSIKYCNLHDIVHYAGSISLNHWKCKTVYNHKDEGNIKENHSLDQWNFFMKNK